MKKFLLDTVKFFLFTIAFYLLFLFLWGEIGPSYIKKNLNFKIGSKGHLFTRVREIPQFKNINILFVGSSRAYRGFDTRIYLKQNLACFNLGSSSQTPLQTEILLKRYLNSLNPKIVIYEVGPDIFEGDGVESSLDLIANDKIDYESFRMAGEINNIKTYNAILYSSIRLSFNLDKNFKEKSPNRGETYIHGGYVETKLKFNDEIDDFENSMIEMNPNQVFHFERIVKSLLEKNIQVILVQAPIAKNRYSSYSNMAEIDNYFSKYQTYWNFNKILSLSDSIHFSDSHHLNQNGDKLFNEKLIDLLIKNEIINPNE
ncbi:MAG: hypothetical protein ABIG69_00865 [Bacteroidota bacterium]